MTPRMLMAARIAMKITAITVMVVVSTSSPKPRAKFEATAEAAVEAEVRPELSTANVTRKVMKWMPKALCVYSAAPEAPGYLVTSSR